MKKFKLTKETRTEDGVILHRIVACKNFGNVEKGEEGGWIEKEENLSQENDAWVFGDARVFDNARVYGNARVSGDAWVYDNARVSGDLKIIGGEFYYTKPKSEEIGKIELDDNYELLCSEPVLDKKFVGWKGEESKGKRVKIRLSDNQVVEGEIIDDDCSCDDDDD